MVTGEPGDHPGGGGAAYGALSLLVVLFHEL